MGCGCNAKKEVEKAEYNAESEETLCGQGKDSYAQKESALYDTFISLSMGAIGYFVTTEPWTDEWESISLGRG